MRKRRVGDVVHVPNGDVCIPAIVNEVGEQNRVDVTLVTLIEVSPVLKLYYATAEGWGNDGLTWHRKRDCWR